MIIVYIEDLSVMRVLQIVLDILSYSESSYITVQRFFPSPCLALDKAGYYETKLYGSFIV